MSTWTISVRTVSNIMWNSCHEKFREQREILPSISIEFLIKCVFVGVYVSVCQGFISLQGRTLLISCYFVSFSSLQDCHQYILYAVQSGHQYNELKIWAQRCTAFNFRTCTPQFVGMTAIFNMCPNKHKPPLKSKFFKSFAVHDHLNKQMSADLGFLPWWSSARSFLQMSSVPACSWGVLIQICLQQVNCMLSWIQFRGLICRIFHFFALKNILRFCLGLLQVVVYLQC